MNRDPSAFVSWVLGLKVWTTGPWPVWLLCSPIFRHALCTKTHIIYCYSLTFCYGSWRKHMHLSKNYSWLKILFSHMFQLCIWEYLSNVVLPRSMCLKMASCNLITKNGNLLVNSSVILHLFFVIFKYIF